MDQSFYYQIKELCLVDYSNVEQAGDLYERKKKGCIALPTMEAKLIACLVAIQEIVRLKRFLQNLRIIIDVFEPTTIYNVN